MSDDSKKRSRDDSKLDKKEKKKKKQKDETIAGYSNTANPWGDQNLTERFVWKLKKDKEKEEGKSSHASKETTEEKTEELLKEIDKVKKRRQERDIEKKKWEEERVRLQREEESFDYTEWSKKEDEFLLQQAKKRSEIRIKEGRPKPIDILYMNLNRDYAFQTTSEPWKIFKGLHQDELKDLKKDIKMYLKLDSHKDFWEALMVVCDKELEEKSKETSVAKKSLNRKDDEEIEGVHKSIRTDVRKILKGKNFRELEKLQTQISQKIESANQGEAIDVEYWEGLLKALGIYKAKAQLREIHAQLVNEAKQILQREERERKEKERRQYDAHSDNNNDSRQTQDQPKSMKEEDQGLVLRSSTSSANDPSEKRKRMLELEAAKLRAAMNGTSFTKYEEKALTEDEMFKRESEIGMEESEELFSDEHPLNQDTKMYTWIDKWRPRKPKYFNRIKTGYEWNKYNQTHYDQDNPPPKIVQGYKFNIFYPDLIDMNKTPQYFLEPSESPDYVILRFHAGPPYQDIAFKIVNKEWEHSHRFGFKCTFERGILHLWYNYKKYKYRK